jgi:leucyl-tRNA synthetase
MKDRYDPADIEARWQRIWGERGSFEADLSAGPKYYVLEMFPYPSGRIHMGHVRNYAIGDVVARYRRARGYQVIHPMGWDAFGLPAENAAIDRKIHPWKWTYDNIATMRDELKQLGYSYEWGRELATCHPGYYRWEQLLFIKMLERGLAYRKTQLVNWCPVDQTVLANEQVHDGKCERCHTPIEAHELPGWYFKITDYAQEMLDGLDRLEGHWDKRVINAQREWIGRSEGVEIDFPLAEPVGGEAMIKVFTTRPDTLYGVTFMSLAAEHPLALALARGTDREADVHAFVQRVRTQDKIVRTAEDTVKEGVFTGRYCRNPVTGDLVQIHVANFVLMDYGTGAVMAVPAHDQRDFEFAKVYGIPIKVVIQPPSGEALDPATMTAAYVEDGVQVNSGPIDGLPNRKGMEAVADMLEAKGQGRRTVSFRLRDWSVSRQRYWGCPIPVIYCEACGAVPEKPENLPVLLPEDVAITGRGGSPLATHPTFSKATCPRCGGPARRDTDTFDTFVESSWYMHRYLCSRYEGDILDREALAAGMPVDQYIGGIEHANGHLMYCRFFHRVLRDLGYTTGDEPAANLLCQGMVCKETYSYLDEQGRQIWVYPSDVDEGLIHRPTGHKVEVGRSEAMSKSKLNGVTPDVIISKFGVDTARFFVLSDSPPEADLHWSVEGVEGSSRYLNRVHKLLWELRDRLAGVAPYGGDGAELSKPAQQLRQLAHASLERITKDLDSRFSFNTALARIRELTEGIRQAAARPAEEVPAPVLAEAARFLVQTLGVFTPHLCEELWEMLCGAGVTPLAETPWPAFDPVVAAPEAITIVVQVNGKLRARLAVAPEAAEDEIKAAALGHEQVTAVTAGKTIQRVIYVPGRLVNVVAK